MSIISKYENNIMTCKYEQYPNLELKSIMSIEKTPKIFTCEKCNFVSKKTNEYNRHLTTKKHLRDTTIVPKHTCDVCEKEFKSYNSLWKHKNMYKCSPQPFETNVVSDAPNTVIDASLIMTLVKENMTLVKENQEFKTLLLENQKIHMEQQNVLINKVVQLSQQPNTVNKYEL